MEKEHEGITSTARQQSIMLSQEMTDVGAILGSLEPIDYECGRLKSRPYGIVDEGFECARHRRPPESPLRSRG